MTDQPRPAPKTPRPITDDPKVGNLSVVIAFRLVPRGGLLNVASTAEIGDSIRAETPPLVVGLGEIAGTVSVAVHEIGPGERSEHEGTVGL